LLRFNLEQCPLPDASVDAVVLLNVLEHIKDDRAALRETSRILRPGGVAVVEVPAGPHLYDVYDRLLMHHRRYSRRMLQQRVRAAGLQILRSSYLGALVYPAFAAVKLYNRRYISRERALQRKVVAGSIAATRSSRLLRLAFGAEHI